MIAKKVVVLFRGNQGYFAPIAVIRFSTGNRQDQMVQKRGNSGFINVELHLVFFFVLLLVIFILGGFWTRIIVASISGIILAMCVYQLISDKLVQESSEIRHCFFEREI